MNAFPSDCVCAYISEYMGEMREMNDESASKKNYKKIRIPAECQYNTFGPEDIRTLILWKSDSSHI